MPKKLAVGARKRKMAGKRIATKRELIGKDTGGSRVSGRQGRRKR